METFFVSGKDKAARDGLRFSSAVRKGLKSSLPLRLLGYGKLLVIASFLSQLRDEN